MNREQAIRAVATRLIAEPTFHGDSPLLAAELIDLAVQPSDDPVRGAAQRALTLMVLAKGQIHGPTHNCDMEKCRIPARGFGVSCMLWLDAITDLRAALSADREASDG